MYFLYSDKFLEHDTGSSHPERKERLLAILEALPQIGISKKALIEPKPAKLKTLLAVHTREHISTLQELSRAGVTVGDNVFCEKTYQVAELAAGSAIDAAELAGKGFAFSICRPPGHHASSDVFEGFCYLNNIAVATQYAIDNLGVERVLIVDFDLHLGQGTQLIFEGREDVFYYSIHQDPHTIYPFRQFKPKAHNVMHTSLPPHTTDEQYLDMLEHALNTIKKRFRPEIVGISAGFDIFHTDIAVGNMLSVRKPKTFHEIGKLIASFECPCFGVLEGGYDLAHLGDLFCRFIEGIMV
jgi:acetoin utilization deacetylase AcuC-like enzyme